MSSEELVDLKKQMFTRDKNRKQTSNIIKYKGM